MDDFLARVDETLAEVDDLRVRLHPAQVKWLLRVHKSVVDPKQIDIMFERIKHQGFTRLTLDTEVSGVGSDNQLILEYFRQRDALESKPKYTISLRFKTDGLQLLRLDIAGRHKNPGESSGTVYDHVHLYGAGKKHDLQARKLTLDEQKWIGSPEDTFIDFLKQTNIDVGRNHFAKH